MKRHQCVPGVVDRHAELERALHELYEWAIDACGQGTGNQFQSTPTWHSFMSVWEQADELLPRVRALLTTSNPDGDQQRRAQ